MTIDELHKQYEGLAWIKGAMEDLLDDLPEHYCSEAPREVYDRDLHGQIEWLIHDCKPPYMVEEIEDDRVPDSIITVGTTMTPEWLKALRRESSILSGIADAVRDDPELLTQLKARCLTIDTIRTRNAAEWLSNINRIREMLGHMDRPAP